MTRNQLKHLGIQVIRRSIQAMAMLLVLLLAFFGLYHHYYMSRKVDDIASIGGWRGEVLGHVDEGMKQVERPEKLLENCHGNLWSMRIAGIEISDPLAFVETAVATRSIHPPLVTAILIPLAFTILLGRVFCSWICPGYLIFEIAGKLRQPLKVIRPEVGKLKFPFINKYLFLGAGLLMAAATSLPVFSMFYPPALLSRIAHAVIFGTGVAGMVTILTSIIIVEIFVSPRWWCRSMCPGGALYGLLGAMRVLRVECVKDLCTHCGECVPVCEEGLNPIEEASGMECDNCGVCIRHCPETALKFSVSSPFTPSAE